MMMFHNQKEEKNKYNKRIDLKGPHQLLSMRFIVILPNEFGVPSDTQQQSNKYMKIVFLSIHLISSSKHLTRSTCWINFFIISSRVAITLQIRHFF